MAVELNREDTVVQNAVSAEQAEGLLEWMREKPSVQVDVAASRILAPRGKRSAQPRGSGWPRDAELREWLESALKPAP
jgi:hypothetical protein